MEVYEKNNKEEVEEEEEEVMRDNGSGGEGKWFRRWCRGMKERKRKEERGDRK